MSDLNSGERQVAKTFGGIRRDHVARYEWARNRCKVGGWTIDVGCGVGYGSNIMASAGCAVVALDKSLGAIDFGKSSYDHANIAWRHGDWSELRGYERDSHDLAVCFEMIEHVEDPMPMLTELRRVSSRLLASVPNEKVFPFKGYQFHHRHYTEAEFEALLNAAGWRVTEWWGQFGPESEVERDCEGRTLIAVCERSEDTLPVPKPIEADAAAFFDAAPRHVVILGLGPSLEHYVDTVKRLGGRKAFADEVWGINAVGGVIQCDRLFHMDDVRVQERRAEAAPLSNIANMMKWLGEFAGPVYTSRIPDDNSYPSLVEFPLEDVVNSVGYAYFNSTAAYAVAFAIYSGAKKISLFGIDFSYPNAHHAEQGRACVEFWLGIAAARGIELAISERSSLLDTIEPVERSFYGYDAVHVDMEVNDGTAKIAFRPRELPTAAQVEARYDHSRHPSPHLRKEGK
jgi:hypothetical protein